MKSLIHKKAIAATLSTLMLGAAIAQEAAALQTTADGPFLLAKLPTGKYVIAATLAGKSVNKQVLVQHGQAAKALFMWPPGVDESHS